VPGVRAATTSGFGSTLMDGGTTVFAVGETVDTPMLAVDANYFETLGLALTRGRLFDSTDTLKSTRVAIVNETFVRRFLPDGDPIGQSFRGGFELRVVGVVADARVHGLREPPPPTFYRPITQLPLPGRRVVVRTTTDATALTPEIREAVRRVDPNLPLQDVSTQADAIEEKYLANERMFATASTAVGMIVLGVTMIGLFGLMSYAVARRTREIGVHMALGAQREQLLRSVLRESLVITGIGTAIGAIAALGAGRLLETQVFGVSRHDPLTIAMAAMTMLLAAGAAALVPATRAAAVNPVVALRSE
jgi:ABC-type antimicrobial peptide transport system permease subunit